MNFHKVAKPGKIMKQPPKDPNSGKMDSQIFIGKEDPQHSSKKKKKKKKKAMNFKHYIKKAQGNSIFDRINNLIQEEVGDSYYLVMEPGAGETYNSGAPTLYFYGTYPESSVNAGMEKRVWVESFDSQDEADAFVEEAIERGVAIDTSDSSGYVKQELPMSPPDWFDPSNAGENWSEEDY